ncbi:threonine/serine exporter family protein [uncultured Porphyromonas sp.]|uniref:threonine/serine exporter family protein n=1 Tax=uncultured Porphyromonas sp. TaxID=159274 RepID=UPI00260EAF89|nr:threonine/serine exporter family protein [uncultured Porphyromonas sp.]
MDFLLILEKGFFAAIAALGFAAVGNPSRAAFRYVPIIAFLGNALRFSLMTYAGMNIAIATFLASVFAGFIAVGFAYHARYPIEVFAFPALLPMIPGQFAYRSILGMIRFMESTQEVAQEQYLPGIISNAITALLTMFALGVGVAIPLFICYQASFRMTRGEAK